MAEIQGLSITPSVARVDLSEDDPEITLVYKNTSATILDLTLQGQNFTQLSDAGKILFLEDKESSNYQYALTSWIQFEKKSLSLQPGEEQMVKLFIDKERLTPGAHYASILAQINQEDAQGNIGLRGVLSSLVFVRAATGKEVEEAKIKNYRCEGSYFTFPTSCSFILDNSGNVDLTIHGVGQVEDIRKNVLSKELVNEDSLVSLPSTQREYVVELRKSTTFLWPGKYKATITITYGKGGQKLSAESTFGYIGYIPLALSLVLIIILYAVLRHLRRRKKSSFLST
jgi:hypothetical protein